MGSLPCPGRSPEEELATHSSILAWETAWTDKPGGTDSLWGRKELDTA